MSSEQELVSPDFVVCARCEKQVERGKSNSIVMSRGKANLTFCDTCFNGVFKYDKNVKTLVRIWEENSKKFPFTARKKSWHPSTYMVVKSIEQPPQESGGKKPRIKFVADLYLHGELKDTNKAIGNANSFMWLAWSEQEAKESKWEGDSESA